MSRRPPGPVGVTASASRPLVAKARAAYWKGRAHEVLGHTQEARSNYETAAQYTTAYYGQIAAGKLGMGDLAKRELVKLADLCKLGAVHPWEFNEWHHADTGRPMGKAYQAWSAASFIRACHDVGLDHETMTGDRF